MKVLLKLLSTYFILFLLTLGQTSAQTFVENVMRFPVSKHDSKDIRLATLEKNGLLVIQNTWKMGMDSSIISLKHINHNFRSDWEKELAMPKQFKVIDHQFDAQYTYLLGIGPKAQYTIIRLKHDDGAYAIIPYKNVEQLEVFFFRAYQNRCVLGGDSRGKPLVISYHLNTLEKNILPSINQLTATLERVEIHKEQNMVSVILKAPKTHRHRGLYINMYNVDGFLQEQYYATPNGNFDLLTFRPFINKMNELMVLGTYSVIDSSYPQGVYSMRLKQYEKENLRFYDFSYLKNFFKHLDEEEQEKIFTRVSNKKGKDKYYQTEEGVILHDLKQLNGEIILSGETAKISYSSAVKEASVVNYRANTPTTKYLVEKSLDEVQINSHIPSNISEDRFEVANELPARVRYNHTFVCSFNHEGHLLWDNNFEINHSRQKFPINMTQSYIDNKKVAFLMVNRDNAQFAISDHQSFQQYVDLFPVMDNRPEETHIEYHHGGLQAWYRNHFVFSGIRDLNNTINGENRRFFYISLFSYTDNRLTD